MIVLHTRDALVTSSVVFHTELPLLFLSHARAPSCYLEYLYLEPLAAAHHAAASLAQYVMNGLFVFPGLTTTAEQLRERGYVVAYGSYRQDRAFAADACAHPANRIVVIGHSSGAEAAARVATQAAAAMPGALERVATAAQSSPVTSPTCQKRQSRARFNRGGNNCGAYETSA